ncbi:retrovirus-related pol polyprotein from transposon TNT 1-94 [Tanacetum coccineum]
MSSMSEDIQCAGSDTRPPMLDRTDFESWQQRIRLYCLGKDNGENIMKSINEGPFHMGTVSDVIAGGTEGAVQQGPVRARVLNDLSAEEKERYTKGLLLISSTYTDANDIWENVKMILEGFELTKDDEESKYTMNLILSSNSKEKHSRILSNTKFVKTCYLREVDFITGVKINRGLKESNFDQLYAYLKQLERNNARGNVVAGNVGGQNRGGIINPGQAKPIKNGAVLDEEQSFVLAMRTKLSNLMGCGIHPRMIWHSMWTMSLKLMNVMHSTLMLMRVPLLHRPCSWQNLTLKVTNLRSEVWASYDSNTPFEYVEDNEEHIVQSNVSSVRDDALMSILDECEQGVQSRLANKPNMVVKDSVTSELARYKELVGEYEKWAKFELTNKGSARASKSLCLTRAKQVQPALYNGHVLVMSNHARPVVHDSEDTREIAEITRKRMLLKMQSPLYDNDRKKAETSVPKPISALIVYPPNTPVKLKLCDLYAKDVTAPLPFEQNDCVRVELEKVKQHYKELYDSIKITRAHTSEKTSTMLNEIESLKAQLRKQKVSCFTRVNTSTEASGSKPRSNTKKNRILLLTERIVEDPKGWQAMGKLFVDIGYQWRPTGKKFTLGKLNCGYQWRPTGKKFALGEMCPLTKLSVKFVTPSSISIWTRLSKHMMGNRSKLKNFVEKFIGTVRFGNDHFGAIMGYGDYVIGDSVISRHTCFVRDINGADLLKGIRSTNLYTISIDDMMKSSPICLLPKASKTPQQNGVVERQNCTLVEAAHTMLIFSNAPMFLWAEAVATTCYTQNRSLIHTCHNKSPYELVHDKKPDLTFLRVFGTLYYPTNDSEDLEKFQAKADIGIFIGEPVPTATIVNALIVSTNTYVSKTIAQDAPSISHSLSSSQVHPLVFPQGVAARPTIKDTSITQADLHTSVNPFTGEPSYAQSTSGGVSLAEPNQVNQPPDPLRKWTKDHPLDNIIGNPSRPVSTRKQLASDALWCCYHIILSKVEPRTSKWP